MKNASQTPIKNVMRQPNPLFFFPSNYHFSEFSMTVLLAKGFKLPNTVKLYDGTTDSQENLREFNSMILLNKKNGINHMLNFICHAEKSALLWFSN